MAARPAAPVSSKRSSSSAARARAAARLKPSRRPIIIMFSVPVSSSSTDANWPVSAISWRTCTASVTHVVPADPGLPGVRFSKVARTRTAVVLPAPLGPRRARTVPGPAAQVNPAQRLGAAEALGQPLGLDRVCHVPFPS